MGGGRRMAGTGMWVRVSVSESESLRRIDLMREGMGKESGLVFVRWNKNLTKGNRTIMLFKQIMHCMGWVDDSLTAIADRV